MTSCGDLMAALDIGDRPFPRLHAVQEVARMQIELLIARTGFLHRFYPRFGLDGLTLRSAGGVPLKHRDRIVGAALHVGYHFESGAADNQAALRSKELQTNPRTPSRARLANGVDRGEAGVFKHRVLCVGCITKTF